MKRVLLLAFVLAALALPPAASARVIELGAGAEPAASNCPKVPCEAIGRVTGYQGRSGTAIKNPFLIPRAGHIVAFTVKLAKLTDQQIAFFNDFYGGPARVRLSILRKSKRRRTRLNHRLLAQSKTYRVDRYFGSSPTLALDRPLRVRRRHIVALTIPTWAPAFAYTNLSGRNWWRSSRRKGDCRNVSQRVSHERVGGIRTYGCTYFKARLLYTATYVPDPRPTSR
jgi:hypothetical protein